MMRRDWMTRAAGAVGVSVAGALVVGALVAGAARPAPATASTLGLPREVARELSSIYRASPGTAGAARQARRSSRQRARGAIVGGAPVKQGTFGYAAFVVYFDADGNPQSACSGTVVSANVVLTAAHCIVDETTLDPLAASGFRVVTGAADWTDETRSQIGRVSQVIPNPSFADITDVADAGLLVLQDPTTAPSIRLAANSERYLYTPGMPAVIAGWGIDDTGTPSTALLSADTAVQGAEYCSHFVLFFDGFWQTCTVQAPGFASGVCSGDSGGPLLTLDVNNRPVQIGVIDMGPQDCNTTTPGFFARTNPIVAWTTSVVTAVAPAGSRPMAAAPDRPVPPTLTDGDARSYAATMVRRRTHVPPRLSVSCLRISAWKLRCDLRWRSRGASYTAVGTFWHLLRGGGVNWSYDVKGRVTRRSCAHAGRCRAVSQLFRWR